MISVASVTECLGCFIRGPADAHVLVQCGAVAVGTRTRTVLKVVVRWVSALAVHNAESKRLVARQLDGERGPAEGFLFLDLISVEIRSRSHPKRSKNVVDSGAYFSWRGPVPSPDLVSELLQFGESFHGTHFRGIPKPKQDGSTGSRLSVGGGVGIEAKSCPSSTATSTCVSGVLDAASGFALPERLLPELHLPKSYFEEG